MILAGIATAAGLPLSLRCVIEGQINYNEGWNAYRQQAASMWQPLYGMQPGLEVTNYPPLSFHLVGLLGRHFGDVVLAGRLVSLLALAVIGFVVVHVGRHLSGSGPVALCCGLCWLVGIEFWTPDRIGSDDPQLLAMAIQSMGLLVFLRRPGGDRSLILTAALIALGLFTKQNLLALPLGMTLSMAMRREWRRLAVWLSAGVAGCLLLLAATIAIDGRLFLAHLLAPRAFLPVQALVMSLDYMLFSLPVLIAVSAWSWRECRSGPGMVLMACWIMSLLEIVLFSGGDGVAGNILQDAIMTGAMLQPPALQWLCAQHRERGGVGAGGLVSWASLLVLPSFVALHVPDRWREWHAMSQQEARFQQGVALLRGRPGPAVCETLLLCFRAGRRSVFDPYYVQDQIRLGRLSEATINRLVGQQVLATVAIGSSEDREPPDPSHQPWRFSRSFMRILWTRYRPAWTGENFTIFVPRREGRR